MGSICQTTHLPREAQNFYENFGSYKRYTEERDTVKIEVRLNNIRGNQNCKIELIIVYPSGITKVADQTENGTTIDTSNNIMSFQKFFMMEYFFQKGQPIKFRISGTINSTVDTSLSEIMGSRGQTLNKKLNDTDGIILEVKGLSYKQNITSTLKFDVGITGKLFRKGFYYTIKSKRNDTKALNQLLYKSEMNVPLKYESQINFRQFTIPDIYISLDGNYDTSLVNIEIYDSKHKKKIGEYLGPLKPLIKKNTEVTLGQIGKGTITVDAITNYSFIEYLRGRMQINLAIAIDFTGSNGHPNLPTSFHYLGPKANEYETAIKACGDILSYYNYDQKFPVYGFGGKFNGSPNVDHCFPLNCNINDPKIFGIDGVLQTYRDTLKYTQLLGQHISITLLIN